jgi:Flp pilus assembly protein TadB
MARQGRGGGRQGPVKGFRPGKEPPQIRKRLALQQYGEVSATQERLIEMFAERSPEEAKRMMSRWRAGLLAGAVALVLVGAGLYLWTLVAGFIVHGLAVVAFYLWWRLRRQREALETMADTVAGRGKGQRKKR